MLAATIADIFCVYESDTSREIIICITIICIIIMIDCICSGCPWQGVSSWWSCSPLWEEVPQSQS